MPTRQLQIWTLTAVCLLALSLTSGALAKRGRRRAKSPAAPDDDYATAPSYRYGELDRDACLAELEKRKIAFTEVDEAPGVLIPVRIQEGVGGVRFHTALSKEKAKESPWEVFDCRLVLALSDFAGILRKHDVDDVLIYSAWRPNRRQPKGEAATRHPGALAVDIYKIGKLVAGDRPGKADAKAKQRVWLDVKKNWHGRRGAKTCGPKAAKPTKKSAEAVELRELICGAAEQRLFTSMLTPNYDAAHRDHFHLEVTPKVTWRLVR